MKIKAMILAAGHGSRLKPITNTIPKPLIKIGEETILERHLRNLQKAGITDVVINVSYLAEKIMDAIGDGSRYRLNIDYSHEKEGALETLGGILNALNHFKKNKYLLLINADIYCNFNFLNIGLPGKNHKAHLVLVPNKNAENPAGDFGITKNVININANKRYTYSGISSLNLESLRKLNVDYNQLGRLYREWATRGLLTGEIYNGLWIDIGTPQRLTQAKELIKEKP